MGKKRGVYFAYALLLLFLIIPSVSSIGISPAKITIDYKEPISVDYEYVVRSNSGFPATAVINLTGDMAEFASADKNEIHLNPGEKSSFTLSLNIPRNHGYEGKRVLWVRAREYDVEGPSQGTIMVTTAVAAAVVVNFPYPGKFLEIYSVTVDNVNEGEDSTLKWEVISRGSEQVSFSAFLDITDKDGTSVYSKNYDLRPINAGETYTLTEALGTRSFKAGKYDVNLSISYEDEKKSARNSFNVGEENVDLIDYKPKKLITGQINKFTLTIQSLWNGEFNNVFAELNLAGTTSTSSSTTLKPFQMADIGMFVDVTNLLPGIYNGTAIIHFGENQKQFPISLNVTEPVIEEEPESASSISVVLVAVIVILFLILALLVFFIARKRKNRKKY